MKKGVVGGSECMTLLGRSCVTGEPIVPGGWEGEFVLTKSVVAHLSDLTNHQLVTTGLNYIGRMCQGKNSLKARRLSHCSVHSVCGGGW